MARFAADAQTRGCMMPEHAGLCRMVPDRLFPVIQPFFRIPDMIAVGAGVARALVALVPLLAAAPHLGQP